VFGEDEIESALQSLVDKLAQSEICHRSVKYACGSCP
jgi:hypothetical protein